VRPYRGVEAFRSSRERMVREEAEARGIRDRRVLQALREVPRHLFADEALAEQAYGGHALPIGWGQTLTQPYTVALMTEALQLEGGEKVFEVGTGSGYQAAILARLGCRVYSMERIPGLARRARRVLDQVGAADVLIRTGDASHGWPEFAPFDRIVVTAGAEELPAPLKEQLADGGILVCPVGKESQEIVLLRRQNGRFRESTLGACRFVPLIRVEGGEVEEGGRAAPGGGKRS